MSHFLSPLLLKFQIRPFYSMLPFSYPVFSIFHYFASKLHLDNSVWSIFQFNIFFWCVQPAVNYKAKILIRLLYFFFQQLYFFQIYNATFFSFLYAVFKFVIYFCKHSKNGCFIMCLLILIHDAYENLFLLVLAHVSFSPCMSAYL